MMARGLHYFSGQHYNQHFPNFLTELIFFKNYYKKFALHCAKGYRIVQHFAPNPGCVDLL